jgi:hypothetical protein
MIKAQIPGQLLMEWFTKSLLPPIAKDVSMERETFEEQAILCAQHLDLIHSHSDTLYDIILHASRPSIGPHKMNLGPHVDGVVGSISSAYVGQLAEQLGNMHI